MTAVCGNTSPRVILDFSFVHMLVCVWVCVCQLLLLRFRNHIFGRLFHFHPISSYDDAFITRTVYIRFAVNYHA